MLLTFLATSAVFSAVLIVVLMPLLQRYALARPNARSSHRVPTPQGGGMAVVAAAALPAVILLLLFGTDFKFYWGSGRSLLPILGVFPSVIVLAILGAIDDIRPLPVLPRFLLQGLAVAAVVAPLTFTGNTILPVPAWIEFAILLFAGLWFVNLVNFMDGLDWITVAEMVPITAFIAFIGFAGFGPIRALPSPVAIMAACLCGALIGFAPFNKPVARLFLGDVGSLPIGLLVGWMLLELANAGALAAAILLPLYYLMDATITLFRRLARGEKVWEAHRSHFYQQATNNGYSALAVSAHVFALNILLAGLAAISIASPSLMVQFACVLAGVILVSALLFRFSKPRLEIAR
nr:glycosyl transferase [Microvirga flavescens]